MRTYNSNKRDPIYALVSYGRYLEAYSVCLNQTPDLSGAQKNLKGFLELSKGTADINVLKPHLFRGWLTTKAIRDFSTSDELPDFVIGNLWVPVQVYYAVYSLGLATLIALGMDPPFFHTKFRQAASNSVVVRLFPWPLNLMCTEWRYWLNPSPCFDGYESDIFNVKGVSNLANPFYLDNPDQLILKVLASTRRWLIDKELAKKRKEKRKPGTKRRRLPINEKACIENNVGSTSVFDFVWRLRVKSNYDDPDIFFVGPEDIEAAKRFYINIKALHDAITLCLENIIERKIGGTEYKRLRSEFVSLIGSP